MRYPTKGDDWSLEQWTVASIVSALAAAIAGPASARVNSAAGIVIAACLAAAPLVAARLPASLRGARRRRPAVSVAWAFMALFTAATLAVLGSDVFDRFIHYQLPRIANGDAFSFVERDGVPVFFVARNVSADGVIPKLRLLDVPGMTHQVTTVVTWAYTVLLVWLAWRTGRATPSRVDSAARWLALVNLAALRSPLAPSAYVVASTLWLLALLAGDVRGRATRACALGAAWIVVMGAPPLPDAADLLIGIVSQGLTIAVHIWVLFRPSHATNTASASVDDIETSRELAAQTHSLRSV